MKNHILNSIFVEEPPIPECNDDNLEYHELEALFQTDDEELVFEGFDTPNLEEVFQTEETCNKIFGIWKIMENVIKKWLEKKREKN